MKAFAQLLDRLSYSPSRNAKLRLMRDYFRSTPDPDRGWGLAVLTDGLPFSFPLRRTLMDMMARRMDPELFRLSRDYVGDTAETIALMWEKPRPVHDDALAFSAGDTKAAPWQATRPEATSPPQDALRLSGVVSELALVGRNDLAPRLEAWLDQLDATGRWACSNC
jgi:DNA ligase-1